MKKKKKKKPATRFATLRNWRSIGKEQKKVSRIGFPRTVSRNVVVGFYFFSEETGFERGELAAVVVEGGGADGENLPFFAAFSLAACDVTG